jgi:uncharacterized membrane protein YraQ (UPF0718 family)
VNEMSLLYDVAIEMWSILQDSAPYILLGILVAGFVKIYINQNFISRHLSQGKYLSVFKASFFGVPLPL